MLIVVNRFRAAHGPGGPGGSAEEDGFRRGLQDAWALLASKPGYAGGEMGRNLDDPTLWVLTTRWENVGSYRRALSAYDVKLNAVPLLSQALDEPSAFESAAPGDDLNQHDARHVG